MGHLVVCVVAEVMVSSKIKTEGSSAEGISVQVEPKTTKKVALEALKVLIIEDAFETRGLVKSHLKQFGIKHITMLENGSSILQENAPLDIDVLLIGFDLGNCHSGIELVQQLSLAGLLPIWCKVIFITNSDVVASSSHPFRYLKCEVLRKPINPRILLNLIIEGVTSIQYFKSVLRDLQENKFDGLLIRLEALPRGELTNNQKDELNAITMHLLLRLGEGNKAWKLANGIQDEVFRATNRLSIANALGDERKLKMTLSMLQANSLMHKRSLIYQVYQFIKERHFSAALELMQSQPTHQYSLAETELYALLLIESKGLNSAIAFLTFKLGTSLENLFFRHTIKLICVKCYLYLFLSDLQLVEEMPDEFQAVNTLLTTTDWQKGSVDFSAQIPIIHQLLDLMKTPENENHPLIFRRLGEKVGINDAFNQLIMATSTYLMGQKDDSRIRLFKADKAMLSLEVTPETLINQIWFTRVFELTFSEPERAREYNRIGIHHAKADNPYQALKMFFLSHCCSPKHASIAINLLDAKTKLGLTQYWEIASPQLIRAIDTLELRENEQRKYAEVKVKLKALRANDEEAISA